MLILDACIVISFANAGYVSVISELRLHPMRIAGRAAAEVIREPALGALARAVNDGSILIESIDLENDSEQDALRRFDARPAFRNRGEAEVLALAAARGYIVASDENAVRKAAHQELGPQRVAGSLDLLQWGIDEDRLSRADAVQVFSRLDRGPALIAQLDKRGRKVEDLFR